MKLSLNTWQRVTCLTIFGAITGNAETIRKAGKIIDLLEMTDADKKVVNWTDGTTLGTEKCPKCGTPVSINVKDGSASWSNAEHRWAIEVKDRNLVDYFRTTILGFSNWQAAHHKQVDDLMKQLEGNE